jgi:hypothetical protein
MNTTTNALRRQMLQWIAAQPRDRAEVMEAWRTSCPRLSTWEDACIDGLIEYEPGTGRVILSAAGRHWLSGVGPLVAGLIESQSSTSG